MLGEGGMLRVERKIKGWESNIGERREGIKI
jgi:hypothetical protein